MARPKGSKNKARTVKASVDYVAVIAEKAAKKEKIESEVATLTANLDDLKDAAESQESRIESRHQGTCQSRKQKSCRRSKSSRRSKEGRSRRCAEEAACQRYDG